VAGYAPKAKAEAALSQFNATPATARLKKVIFISTGVPQADGHGMAYRKPLVISFCYRSGYG
jgi:hypothetical protein